MGGISVMVMLSVMGAVAFVILGVVALALAMFVAATVVSIVFACRAKARREQGKRFKGLVAVPHRAVRGERPRAHMVRSRVGGAALHR